MNTKGIAIDSSGFEIFLRLRTALYTSFHFFERVSPRFPGIRNTFIRKIAFISEESVGSEVFVPWQNRLSTATVFETASVSGG